MSTLDPIVEVSNLCVRFPIKKGIFARTVGYVSAVDEVSFSLLRGETLALVGESGSGKTTISRAVLGLVKPSAGTILFHPSATDKPLAPNPSRTWSIVQAVFQDPLASLNPRHTVEEILTEAAVVHGRCARDARAAFAAELLRSVGLPDDILLRYPHEFSGGQRQRLSIARAIALKPAVLICDEAVSALDLSVRAQVLDLLSELKKRLGLSILFITHDLGVVRHIADRVLVLNHGRIVESGLCATVLESPKDAYTRALVAAVPRLVPRRDNIEGGRL